MDYHLNIINLQRKRGDAVRCKMIEILFATFLAFVTKPRAMLWFSRQNNIVIATPFRLHLTLVYWLNKVATFWLLSPRQKCLSLSHNRYPKIMSGTFQTSVVRVENPRANMLSFSTKLVDSPEFWIKHLTRTHNRIQTRLENIKRVLMLEECWAF